MSHTHNSQVSTLVPSGKFLNTRSLTQSDLFKYVCDNFWGWREERDGGRGEGGGAINLNIMNLSKNDEIAAPIGACQ